MGVEEGKGERLQLGSWLGANTLTVVQSGKLITEPVVVQTEGGAQPDACLTRWSNRLCAGMRNAEWSEVRERNLTRSALQRKLHMCQKSGRGPR